MLRFQSLAGVALVAIVAFVGVVALATLSRPSGGVGAVSPSPSASPSASPSGSAVAYATFQSTRHGYGIGYPSDWTVTPANKPWLYGTDTNDASRDVFTPPLGPMASRIRVASQRLPSGMSESAWRDGYIAGFPTSVRDTCVPSPGRWVHVTVDGVDLASYTGCDWVDAMAFSGGRVYMFTVEYALNTTSTSIFDQMLRTVVFHPEAADDTPASSTPSGSASSSP